MPVCDKGDLLCMAERGIKKAKDNQKTPTAKALAGDGRAAAAAAAMKKEEDARKEREKEAREDRLLCTICMEADAPRSVLFGPCNHFLACASCAALRIEFAQYSALPALVFWSPAT